MCIPLKVILFVVFVLDRATGGGTQSDLEAVLSRPARALFFPQFTVLQFTVGVATPIENFNRKVAMNFAVQCNYDLPYTYTSFTNPTYWKVRKAREAIQMNNSTYGSTGDLSGGEFYTFIKRLIVGKGYDEQCLEKAICEMSKFPLEHDGGDNLLTEIVEFIFRPSIHNSFADDELAMRQQYEKAEFHGIAGTNCDDVYPKCRKSPLDDLTFLKH